MDGRQVLEQVKSDPSTSSIPIVILTTAQHDEDIARCYALGCNSYVVKPMDLHDFIHLLSVIGDYWFNIVMRSC
jgi:two-component system response regulator